MRIKQYKKQVKKQKQRINILVKNGIYPTFVIYKYYIEGYGKREK